MSDEIIDAEFEVIKPKKPFSWRRFLIGPSTAEWQADWTDQQRAFWKAWPWWRKLAHNWSPWPMVGAGILALPHLVRALAGH